MVTPTENTASSHNSSRLPNPHAANSGSFYERYRHPPSSAGSSRSSPCPVRYAPFSYDQRVCPHTENSRAAYKRKSTNALPPYYSGHGYCSAGSSTTFPDPRNNSQLKPEPELRWPYPFSSSAAIDQADNLLYASAQRNVRRRHDDASHNPAWQSSSNPPHQLYPSVNNFSPSVVGPWGNPHLPGAHAQWIHHTDAGCSSYGMNQFVAGNVLAGGNTSNCGSFQYSLPPTSHYSMPRGTESGPSRYSHRQIPRRTSSSYRNLAFRDNVPLGVASVALARNPTQLARDGGLRISNEVTPLFEEENARFRWTSQVPDMIDLAPYFTSLDMFDEHRNLRLDIDAMSYEELLALEERIGNVNTGLSEDRLPSCLTVSSYSSSSQAQDDLGTASCPICLEEYLDNDSLGMMRCSHFYHVSCIKDWLKIKNACPICKSPAALDEILK